MSTKLRVNQWPDSQTCIGCKFAVFINAGYNVSAYGCPKELKAKDKCKGRKEATPKQWMEKF